MEGARVSAMGRKCSDKAYQQMVAVRLQRKDSAKSVSSGRLKTPSHNGLPRDDRGRQE